MIEKICKNCSWGVFRASSSGDEMIDDRGISNLFLCRKLNIKIYGNDRCCPNFVLSEEYFKNM